MPIGEDDDVDPASNRRYRTPRSVRLARERMNLSLVEFAQRFGIRFDTVRSWEEGDGDIEDRATLALLQVIEREPKRSRAYSRGAMSREDRTESHN
jgi:DNA-binding transcriptional regulator YiaG